MKKVFLSLLAVAATCNLMAAGVEAHYSVALGYNHSYMRLNTNVPGAMKSGLEKQMETFNFDGFEVGALVDLDFVGATPANHILSLQTGLMYTFGDYNYYLKNKDYKKDVDDEKKAIEDAGGSMKISNNNYMHVLSVPVRFKYTYQINDAWSVNAFTGPEFRFNVSVQNVEKYNYEIDDYKMSYYYSSDLISGKEIERWEEDGEKAEDKSTMDKDERLPVFDMAWGFGIGASWKNLGLTVRYDLGMFNLSPKVIKDNVKDAGYKCNMNRDAVAVVLSYRIK